MNCYRTLMFKLLGLSTLIHVKLGWNIFCRSTQLGLLARLPLLSWSFDHLPSCIFAAGKYNDFEDLHDSH